MNLKGIHVHIGSQITHTRPYVKSLKKVLDFIEKNHVHIDWLNVGGGFGINYKEDDARTAKEIAAYLAEEIMKVFGGHPTVVPTGMVALDYGNHLITQYVSDDGVRTGDEEYSWLVSYLFRLDVYVTI